MTPLYHLFQQRSREFSLKLRVYLTLDNGLSLWSDFKQLSLLINTSVISEGLADVLSSCRVKEIAALLRVCFPLSSLFSPPFSVSSHPRSLLPGRSCLFPFEDGFLDDGHVDPSLTPGLNSPTRCQNGERMERYSRKVFVGGLPPDIDEGEDTSQILSASAP